MWIHGTRRHVAKDSSTFEHPSVQIASQLLSSYTFVCSLSRTGILQAVSSVISLNCEKDSADTDARLSQEKLVPREKNGQLCQPTQGFSM